MGTRARWGGNDTPLSSFFVGLYIYVLLRNVCCVFSGFFFFTVPSVYSTSTNYYIGILGSVYAASKPSYTLLLQGVLRFRVKLEHFFIFPDFLIPLSILCLETHRRYIYTLHTILRGYRSQRANVCV